MIVERKSKRNIHQAIALIVAATSPHRRLVWGSLPRRYRQSDQYFFHERRRFDFASGGVAE